MDAQQWPPPRAEIGEEGQLTIRENQAVRLLAFCPNCNQQSAFDQAGSTVIWPQADNETNFADRGYKGTLLRVWHCRICDRSVTYLIDSKFGEEGKREVATRRVWPERAPRSLPSEAPHLVQSLYREASICEFADVLRGAAGLYRAATEALLDALDIPRRGLELGQRIERLKDSGVEDKVVEDLHEARAMGNWSLHEGVTFAPEEVADVAVLLAEAVRELYVEPQRRRAFRESRERRGKGASRIETEEGEGDS